tara:strand:+ start:783 stop:1439 length:657 start_codon:yes stop_codon:yes gene_type:complete
MESIELRNLDQRIRREIDQKQQDDSLTADVMRSRFDRILNRYEIIIKDKIEEEIEEEIAEAQRGKVKNLFQLAGSKSLGNANMYSRKVSTILGSAWEEMAALSHIAVSPEESFNIRIKGVDIVFLEGGLLRHTQIKTKKDTLTGSQTGRSIDELNRHPNPLFAAAFDLGKCWTFPPIQKCGIERLAGKAFWDKLNIDYSVVKKAATDCLLRLEKDLFA